jgi:molecular chaperone DnaK (HSP70)
MNFGLVVGCSRYDDPDINSLKYPAFDAKDIATLLITRCGLAADEVTVLASPGSGAARATFTNVIRELTTATKRIRNAKTAVDKVFLFFSGHGFHSALTNSDYALPADAVASALEETSIPFELLAKHLSFLNAKTTVLFLDLCRAVVTSGKGSQDLTPAHIDSFTFKGTATFWSCSPGEKSYEAEQFERGVFTYAVVKAFSDSGKCKTVYELDDFLVKTVPRLSTENGLPVQNPYTRVEPLKIKDSILVTPALFREWQQLTPIGDEQRKAVKRSPSWQLACDVENICAVDFGTSYSAIGTVDRSGKVVMIPSPEGKYLVPSVVSVLPDLQYLVGWRAIEHSRSSPESTFFNLKRSLGSGSLFNLHGRTFSPEFLASLIVRSLKTNAEEFLGQSVSKVIISAPANFTVAQCNALVDCFKLADFHVARLVSEPSAAALVAARDLIPNLDSDSIVYVLDLGGGTFDVSVLQVGEGVWEIKSAGGDRTLGGVDYDEAVRNYIESIVQKEFDSAVCELGEVDAGQMRLEAERVKIALGSGEETLAIVQNVESPLRGITNVEVPITRGLFRALTEALDQRVERCILDALGRSGVRKKTVALLLSAGQGAKIFTVRETIERLFPGIPIEARYQENAVSLGLARYTGVLKGVIHDQLLLDAIPTSIAIKCKSLHGESSQIVISTNPLENQITTTLIPRDTTIPTKKSETCVLAGLYQGSVRLAFVELEMGGATTPIIEKDLFLPHEFEITVDIDANRTLLVHFSHLHSSKRIETIQLNNFFQPASQSVALTSPAYPHSRI